MTKISFVIPAYNEEHYIGKCLESVAAEVIAHPEISSEIIVVNNASTDNTPSIVSRFAQVQLVNEHRKGLTFAREAGFRASEGMLIANIDADTRLPKGWLTRVIHEFDKNEELVALSGPFVYEDLSLFERLTVKIFYESGLVIQHIGQRLLRRGAMLQGGNFILRRTALEQIGGFDTSITFYGEDTDIARRISKVGTTKWTFDLPVYTSGRRLKNEGIIRVGVVYAINYLSTAFAGKPTTKAYTDIRE